MDSDVNTRRALLIRIRNVVECYERHAQNGIKIMRGVRYDLAVRATEVNGDGCQFPACGCPKADCASRPQCPPLVEWNGPSPPWS